MTPSHPAEDAVAAEDAEADLDAHHAAAKNSNRMTETSNFTHTEPEVTGDMECHMKQSRITLYNRCRGHISMD